MHRSRQLNRASSKDLKLGTIILYLTKQSAFSLSLLTLKESLMKLEIQHSYLVALLLSKSGSEEESQLLRLLQKFISVLE